MSGKSNILLFFTGVYPYGRQEAFIENEIHFLANQFDQVLIFPQSSGGSLRPVPKNVSVFPLPVSSGIKKALLVLWYALISPVFWCNLSEVFAGKNPVYRVRTLLSYVGLARMYRAEVQSVLSDRLHDGDQVYLYSYWLDRNALAMVLLRRVVKAAAVVSRVHRFDVYEERNPDSYLPLRKFILGGVDAVYSISQDAVDYLSARYAGLSKYFVSRLGTTRGEEAAYKRAAAGVHLVSVSNVIPVKRVSMIARSVHAFAKCNPALPVLWTHFGDGPLFDDLKKDVAALGLNNLKVDLRGGQLNSVIKSFYSENFVDLFINLSESEGIPVSFMEAMSYRIPVLATDVGGVSEIIDETCGYLLQKDVTEEQVAERIHSIFADRQAHDAVAARAYDAWEQRYSASATYPKFCSQLMGSE